MHFIGANKPWSSLSYRASRPAPSEHLPFDYQSLVDRWFGVYDKHVRPSVEGAKRFEVPANVAAWEAPRAKTAALGLEELKRVATQGWAQTSGPTGGYASLPLDGRIDLMRPRLASPEAVASPLAAAKEDSPEGTPPYQKQWDPSRDPAQGKGEAHGMTESKYGNTWDASEADQKAAHKRWREGGQGGQAVWEVPKELRDGRYNVTSEHADSSLVGKVFPWESRHRKTASRVFPTGEAPPPSHQQPKPASPGERPYQAPPPPANFHQAMKSYSNAWDDVPAIKKYVTRLTEPAHPTPPPGSEGAKTPPGGRGRREDRTGGAGGRKEPSRDGADDGDDEDEESESNEPHLDGPRGPPKRRDGRGGGGGGAGGGPTGSRGSSRGSRPSDQSSGGGRGSSSHGASAGSTYQSHNASSSHYSHASAQTESVSSRDAGVQYTSESESVTSTSGSSTPTNSSQVRRLYL